MIKSIIFFIFIALSSASIVFFIFDSPSFLSLSAVLILGWILVAWK